MRSFVTAVSVIAVALGSLYDNNYLVRPNEIAWSDSVRLTWANFGGLVLPYESPKLHIQLKGSQTIVFSAICSSSIVYSKEENTYVVRAIFYSGRSNFKIYSDTLKPTAQSLRHELYHFHLTELQSRDMRRNIAAFEKAAYKFDIEDLLKKHMMKLDSASNVYDVFTRHGIERQNQILIEKYIDSVLVATSNFKLASLKNNH
jgi:hypothetical protein